MAIGWEVYSPLPAKGFIGNQSKLKLQSNKLFIKSYKNITLCWFVLISSFRVHHNIGRKPTLSVSYNKYLIQYNFKFKFYSRDIFSIYINKQQYVDRNCMLSDQNKYWFILKCPKMLSFCGKCLKLDLALYG